VEILASLPTPSPLEFKLLSNFACEGYSFGHPFQHYKASAATLTKSFLVPSFSPSTKEDSFMATLVGTGIVPYIIFLAI